MPKPGGCPDLYDPVCACDGTVYSSPCDAQAAGFDVNAGGGCTAPSVENFACGYRFCMTSVTYCQIQYSDIGGEPNGYQCLGWPMTCMIMGNASCGCMSGELCGEFCEEPMPDQFVLSCPGG